MRNSRVELFCWVQSGVKIVAEEDYNQRVFRGKNASFSTVPKLAPEAFSVVGFYN